MFAKFYSSFDVLHDFLVDTVYENNVIENLILIRRCSAQVLFR